ncbi:KPN_02809 family neutral zinc metallopeptidase [Pseudooceanicola algae]|uniref:Uncharacterized protein n=1 Tax=Pseudooceanicola algae TaxID=1537215 RepID=A0A418SIW0_9RHOB|nr:neutral zinc metallopeptidase [Pseudooceanicola algae]QPM91130.1 hypothetical protein PSAL_023790 [Pseudooceanicola algae]
MRLKGRRASRNIDDRRAQGGRGRGSVGGIGGLGIGGVLLVLAIGWFAGVDVTPLLTGDQGSYSSDGTTRELSAEEETAGQFAAQVLATTEDVWAEVLPRQVGIDYELPVMVLFSGVTNSGCGGASQATGPFYCPLDNRVYLDTDFFATLERELGAEGDFAAAYVVGHEVGHHVQNQLGILGKANRVRSEASESEANAMSVRIELQADCFAGVWASYVDGLLEPGDVQEAVNAARMIGDDRLQEQAGRVPQPHSFTHGTSEQRANWFTTGYRSGELGDCDTFNAARL